MGTVTSLMIFIDTSKMVYFTYFHSELSYGLIFWRNSTERNEAFNVQKRIMTDVKH
jgi:hypothetical protein